MINIRIKLSATIFLLTFGLTTSTLKGQSENKKALKVYEQAGDFIARGQLDAAVEPLLKSVEIDPNWLQPRIRLGALYFEKKNWEKSKFYFKSVLEIDSLAEPMIYYKLAEIEWINQDYSAVINYVTRFLLEEAIKPDIKSKAEKYLRDANYLNHPQKEYSTNIEILPNTINTDELEYLPSFPAREDLMIFTRRVRGQEDFYISKLVNGEWQQSTAISELNTSENEGAHCLSADGRMLIFTACDRRDGEGSCDLYYSLFDGQRWSKPANLGPTVNSRFWDGQPSLSSNGRTLYFSSERPGGKGGRDLWKIDRKGGGWGIAVNLSELNTSGNEEVPFVHAADQNLYFMSDGFPGYGGSDLFVSKKQDNQWQSPINLGKPINTSEDEGALCINLSGTKAYFARTTATDDQSRLQIDIYSFDIPADLRPVPATYAAITIRDKKTDKPVQAVVEIINLTTSKLFTKVLSTKMGEILVCIPTENEFAVNISKEGYAFHSDHIEVPQQSTINNPKEFSVYLTPIDNVDVIVAEPIVLNNVFFESGSAKLLSKSDYELNQLFELLNKNAQVKIEIRGHTDNVGTEADNQILSEQRAKAIFNYLSNLGINENRMVFKGFGESSPVADNDTEEGRQKNRRTEFIILKNDKE